MRSVHTEIFIRAPQERVWGALTEFSAHQRWDPFFAEIAGELRPGERLRVRFRDGMTLWPRLTIVEPLYTLEWLGHVMFPGILDGRHRFEMRAESAGTRFSHAEQFTGLLLPLVGSLLRGLPEKFAAFNEAIKRIAEDAG